MRGWIKLHRQIVESDIWNGEDQEPFDRRSAWIYLLLIVNREDKDTIFDGKVFHVKRGQKIISIRKLAEHWNWSRDRVSRYLNLLENLKMIERKSTNRMTLLTIVNYDFYQGRSDTDKDTDEDTHKDTDGTLTGQSQGHSQGQSQGTNKNNKNIKNNQEENKEVKEVKNYYGTFANVQLSDPEYEKLMEKFPDDFEERIDCLSEYMRSKGKTYKSHYATILNWDRMEQKRQQDNKPKTSAYMDALKNRVDVVDSWT